MQKISYLGEDKEEFDHICSNDKKIVIRTGCTSYPDTELFTFFRLTFYFPFVVLLYSLVM